jgi:hypothetical protein
MSSKGQTDTSYTYVVISGKTVIPLMKLPLFMNSVLVFDDESMSFKKGELVWDMDLGGFILV